MNPAAWLPVRAGLDMLCVISGGNWNNGSNAGVWALNLNNVRGNSNNNIGLRADSEPGLPHAALADWHRGSPRRGWCRNLLLQRPSVAIPARVDGPATTGPAAPCGLAA
jgi:hypothetical protein